VPLQRADLVPHFEAATVDGRQVAYSAIWQRRNLVLITLPTSETTAAAAYVAALEERTAEFAARETDCVITRDSITGLSAPAAVVADRWGEIVFVTSEPDLRSLPTIDELLDWVTYVQHQCPECQGEVK
jgi:peroxiredoxin